MGDECFPLTVERPKIYALPTSDSIAADIAFSEWRYSSNKEYTDVYHT
jgi:hypothetical protein